jgi:hypothetical protein
VSIEKVSINLKTKPVLNIIKMLLSLIIIFIASLLYGGVDWNGLEIIIYLVFVLGIGWNFRIDFSGCSEHLKDSVNLRVKKNIFGNCKIKLSSHLGEFITNTKIKRLKTTFDFEEQGYRISLSNLREAPMYLDVEIKKMSK